MQKGGKKKTAWMQHVTKTMEKMPNVALKDVLKAASKTYKKGKSVAGTALMVTKRRRRRRGRGRRFICVMETQSSKTNEKIANATFRTWL